MLVCELKYSPSLVRGICNSLHCDCEVLGILTHSERSLLESGDHFHNHAILFARAINDVSGHRVGDVVLGVQLDRFREIVGVEEDVAFNGRN
jgi:hypothetical protein